MNKILITLLLIVSNLSLLIAQSTCASPMTMANGACVTNQAIPGTGGLTSGGCSPDRYLYIRFTAGSCNQFTVDMNGGNQAEGLFYILDNSCNYVSGTAVCGENVLANVPFVLDANGVALTVGSQYVMVLGINFPNVAGNPVVQTFDICFQSSVSEAASNECSGALSLGTASTTFFNGGNCSFSGSLNDATTSDPAAVQLCAGSLENTQWIKFQPTAGVTSFQIIGSNINCTGGGCGFQFGMFSGSCGALTSEGCYGNKVCNGGQSTAGPTNTSSTDGFSIAWSGTSSTGFTATITKTGGGAFLGTEVFYLVMDGNAAADCQYTLAGVNIQVLPIELVSFTGENNGDYNILKWLTATEINNDYFTLEKSIDAITFEIVGFVNGAGNSKINTKYSLIDKNLCGPLTYYRLRQTDFNGDNEVSEIIAVSCPINDKNLKVIKITNILGQEVSEDTDGIKIYFFINGTVLKRYKIVEK